MVTNRLILPVFRFFFTNRRSWLWTALLLFSDPVLAARIEVSLDRNPVPLGESFTLIFSATETPDGDPDFGPLQKDFEVLGQSQSSRISLVNGQASRSIEWQVTVMAKKPGTLEIPSLAFGADRSEPFAVTIVQGRAGSKEAAGTELLLEVEAEPKNPYVQAQVIYTIRVLSRIQIGEARLGTPEAAEALIEKLDGVREGFITRNGMKYKVTEIRYAVFPQKSGSLRIEPVRLDAQVPVAGRALFNQFFNPTTRSRRLQSDPVELDVRPVPAEFAGRHWLPATRLELEDSWALKPPQVASGEPLTRALSLKAEGATVGVLPELDPAAPSNGIRHYPDQPALSEEKRGDGIVSLRQERTALIASEPGTYRLPAVEIPWWNTRTDRPEVARLPERILTVLPSAHTRPPPQPTTETVPPAEPAPAAVREEVKPGVAVPERGPWFWLALLFGLGWLATLLAWWRFARRSRGVPNPPPAADPYPSKRQYAEVLERACKANDSATARRALAAWATHCCPAAPSLEELARRCGGEFGREIARLDRLLYAPGRTDWQGAALWRSFKIYSDAASASPGGGKPAVPELEPLYRL